jgi:hypothetical protein
MMMHKPSITIDLKKHLYDFLGHEFEFDKRGAIILTRRKDIGIFIDSMWCVSNKPVFQVMENPVVLILPVTKETHYKKNFNFIYVPEWKQKQIELYLEAEFRRRVRDFFTVGYEKKFKQKDIIYAFLEHYGIKNNVINFEQIKKLDFRNRKNFKKNIKIEIQASIIQ